MGFPIGVYQIEIFEEAAKSPPGFITIDFLRGTTEGGPCSLSLKRAIELYRNALPDLLRKQRVSLESFRMLTARFANGETRVTIEDNRGSCYEDDYYGVPLKLKPVVDRKSTRLNSSH